MENDVDRLFAACSEKNRLSAAEKEEKKRRTTFPQKSKSVEKKINNSDRELKTKKRYDIIGL